MRKEMEEEYGSGARGEKNYLFDTMDEELLKEMEEVRLGKKELGGNKR